VPLFAAALAVLLGFAGNFGWWAWQGTEVALPPPPGRVACMSYAPYRRGESPFQGRSVATHNILQDLQVLAPLTRCVRTYSMMQGLEAVPRFAGRYDLQVMAGAWIGADHKSNALEVEALVRAANAFPAVTRLIVGNEVLLRAEMDAVALAGYLDRVRKRVKQPVTYADVWEFWLRNPDLARHVDFITIHLLPYWEDEPIAADRAVEHVVAIYQQVKRAFPDKPIVIGEVGWPSVGRMREGARPGHPEQAAFIRGFLQQAERRGFDYNLIEAFDQPWKKVLEGAVGGYWGLLDADREAKPVLAGPVSRDPGWRLNAAYSLGLGALLLAFFALRHRPARALGWVLLAGATQAGAVVLVEGTVFAVATGVTWLGQTGGLAAVFASAVALCVALEEALRLGAGRPPLLGEVPAVAELLRRLPRPFAGRADRSQLFGWLRFGLDLGALTVAAAILIDPRYRVFPTPLLLVAAVALLALGQVQRRPAEPAGDEERLLAALYLLLAPAIVFNEGLHNVQALWFAGVLVLLGLGRWPYRRSDVSRASSRASAPSSA